MRSSPVHKFLNLSAVDRRLLVTAVLLLGAIRLGLWLLPFQTMMRLLPKMTRHATHASVLGASVAIDAIDATDARRGMHPDRVVWAVVVASRYVPMSTCLTQALTTQVLLARRGFPAHLHIGVAKEGAEARFEAHAWVESEGKVVIGGSDLGRYTQLLALEGEEP